jgi:predicted aspartyl protease
MDKYGFKKFGRVFVPMFIKPNDGSTMQAVQFMVDTGADYTTISKLTLFSLGYNADWIRQNMIKIKEDSKPNTATGERINASYVQLPLINLLGYEAKNWAFQIIIDEEQDFVNLLGRDLLTGFNYSFNNDEDEFTIARAKAFKPRSEFLPGQEINVVVGEE